MEELLPLLIGIIWLAYTWYSKGQKDKRKPASEKSDRDTRTREPSILEQILMGQEIRMSEPEEIYQEEEQEPVYEYEEVTHREAQRTRQTPQPSKAFLNTELSQFKGEGIFAEKKDHRILHLLQEEEVYGNEFDVSDFDLRKAVIYSEILNPPYIDYK